MAYLPNPLRLKGALGLSKTLWVWGHPDDKTEPRGRPYFGCGILADSMGSNGNVTSAAAARTDVVIGIVVRAGKVLICQRPEGKAFAGYWEFPGGKREPGETIEQCLRRELVEELAIDVTPVRALATVDHDYPRGKIRLHPYVCAQEGGEPQLLACQRVLWVAPAELLTFQFPPANASLLAEAIAYLSAATAPGAG